jgi:hypothetical protein
MIGGRGLAVGTTGQQKDCDCVNKTIPEEAHWDARFNLAAQRNVTPAAQQFDHNRPSDAGLAIRRGLGAHGNTLSEYLLHLLHYCS